MRHPCVVAIHDAGIDDAGNPYCAMELLEGETLAARVAREGRIAPAEAVALAASVASALQAVHNKGFLHRDVKPSNIFLARRPDGGVDPKLIDFGIAKRVAVEPEVVKRVTTRRLGNVRAPQPTAAGVIVGTPCYLSPEQIMGTALDARSDVYALASTLYEALAGTPPFTAQPLIDLLETIVCEAPEPLAKRAPEAAIPEALDREILRALAKDPAERHGSAADFAAALWAALATARMESSAPPPPLPTTSRGPIVVIAVSLAMAAVIGVALLRRPATPRPPPPVVVNAVTSAAPPPAPPIDTAPEVTPASATVAPPPRPRAPRASTTAAPAATASSKAPAPNLRMDDLKVPY
ncbi:MAG: serine/threonine-protein kinase [Minicystis sp.]